MLFYLLYLLISLVVVSATFIFFKKRKSTKKAAIISCFIAILLFSGYSLLTYMGVGQTFAPREHDFENVDPTPAVPREETLTGEYVCLPHRDTTGPQTMECAFGLKTNDGAYYALSVDQALTDNFKTGKKITVSGLVVPAEALSTDHWRKYDIKGIMQVKTVEGD